MQEWSALFVSACAEGLQVWRVLQEQRDMPLSAPSAAVRADSAAAADAVRADAVAAVHAGADAGAGADAVHAGADAVRAGAVHAAGAGGASAVREAAAEEGRADAIGEEQSYGQDAAGQGEGQAEADDRRAAVSQDPGSGAAPGGQDHGDAVGYGQCGIVGVVVGPAGVGEQDQRGVGGAEGPSAEAGGQAGGQVSETVKMLAEKLRILFLTEKSR